MSGGSDPNDELLPQNDSIFDKIEYEGHDTTTDSMQDDSFSSAFASTPVGKGGGQGRGTTRATSGLTSSPSATARSGRTCTFPMPGCSSPASSTRSRTRHLSPANTPPSPAVATRSSTRSGTPTPGPSSPALATRRRTRSGTPTPGPSSPALSTRSRTRSGTPTPGRSSAPASGSVDRPATSTPLPRSGNLPLLGVTPLPTGGSSTFTLPRPATCRRFSNKLKCPECPAYLANAQTLAVHKKKHALKRAFARAATAQEFAEAMPELLKQALENMVKEPCVGDIAAKVKEFSAAILNKLGVFDEFQEHLFNFLSEELYAIASDHSSVFVSSLQYEILVGVNKKLNCKEFRTTMKGHIIGLDVPDVGAGVLNVFLGGLMLQLTSTVIIYYVKKIHGVTATDEVRRKRSADETDSINFLQLSYHIGGSIVSGFLFKGEKYKDSSWKKFATILRSKFLRVQAVGNACADEVREYTESIDRGGLKHISQEALDFFVVTFDHLMSLEGEDGSLPLNVPDDFILKDATIICLWDVLVGSDLDEDSSLKFLEQVANACKMVVMKGIMKRRLNEYLKKAISIIPLRSRLAQ